MGRFSGRINKLFLRTHFYISKNELELMRDYFKAQLDDNGVTTNDLKNECDEVERLHQKRRVDDESDPASHKITEIYKSNSLVFYAFLHRLVSKDVKANPDGIWLDNGNIYLRRILEDAKRYFKSKKTDQ